MSLNTAQMLKETEEKLLKVRADGKVAYISCQNCSITERPHWQKRVAELQLEMMELQTKREELNEITRIEGIRAGLSMRPPIEVPTDNPRVAAIFLSGGLNGIYRAKYYRNRRITWLKDQIERLKGRLPNRPGDKGMFTPEGENTTPFLTAEEELEGVVAEIFELDTIIEWAEAEAEKAIATMPLDEFFNPELHKSGEPYRGGRNAPKANQTPFD